MLAELASRFAHPHVRFYQQDQLLMIELSNSFGSATLTTHGATLLSYVPRQGKEVIWVSDTAVYDGSKPVRGGVPVCWPWFGAYEPELMGADPSDAGKKAHGFARYETWQVAAVSSQGEATQVVLSLTPNASIEQVWPFDFKLSLAVTLGEKLTVELIGENRSERDWVVSEALHTYFRVAQAPDLVIEGLENTDYLDKNLGFSRQHQAGALQVRAPMDCVYVDHHGSVVLQDAGNQRQILMEKINSASTIVWNPGAEGAKSFADMPDDQYQVMLCVEAGNALQNAYTLPAGGSHTLGMVVSVR